MNLALALTAFALIFPVELPDKTFVATLVLATRYRPMAVWIGVTLAFLVQTIVAVTLGGLLGRLPQTPVHLVAAALFLIGGFILLRGADKAEAEKAEAEEEFAAKAAHGAAGTGEGRFGGLGSRAAAAGWGGIVPSFLVLFVAEWGDLSQLLTAGLAARYDDPVSIGVGAFLALATISGLGAALGRQLLKRLSLSTIRRVGGSVCLILGTLTLLTAAGVDIPLIG